MNVERTSPLVLGNQAFDNNDYTTAIEQYLIALDQIPELSDIIEINIRLARVRQGSIQKAVKIAVVVHVYYLEIWPEIAQLLKAITHPFDLFVTTTTEQAETVVPAVTADFPKVRLHIQPNNGMDVLPFLALIPLLVTAGYLAVCKLHTKRGDGGEEVASWRRVLLHSLIGDDATFTEVVQSFVQHADLQLVGPASLYLSARKLMLNNEANVKFLWEQLENRPLPVEDWGFFAGSMLWLRPTAVQKLAQTVAYLQAQRSTEYQLDGQISHAIERLLGLVAGLNQGQVGLLHSAVASSAKRYVLQVVPAHSDHQPHYLIPSFDVFIDVIATNVIEGWCISKTNIIKSIELRKDNIKINETGHLMSRKDVQNFLNFHHDKVGFRLVIPPYALKINAWNLFELLDSESGYIICTIAIVNRLLLPFLYNVISPNEYLLYSKMFIKSLHSNDFWISAWQKNNANTVAVDVIIPIYKGYVETINCINSVIQAQTQINFHIILINDATPDEKLATFLQEVKNTDSRISLLINDNNLGFVRSVNRGFEHSKNDVVILNADTEVFDGWIDRLQIIAYNQPNIGTVTPLSNNAEILNISSVDRPIKINSQEGKYLNNLVIQLDHAYPIDIPVGVGFCMYMKRDCLRDVGFFNADEWGMGYGEEVDFCLRAMQKGWRNVAAPNVFVIHYGGVSFGISKDQHVADASKKIVYKYPFYDQLIQNWIQINPLRLVHNQVFLLLLSQSFDQAEFDIHLSHTMGGGTEKYILMQISLAKQRNVNVIRLYAKPNRIFSLEFIIPNLDESKKRILGNKLLLDFVEPDEICELKNFVFNSFKINTVYVHSLLFCSHEFIQELITLVKSYTIVVHDYSCFCPRIHLYQANGQYCNEPDVTSCTSCLLRYPIHSGTKILWEDLNQSYTQWLNFNHQFFKTASQAICGSADVKHRLLTHEFENDIVVKCYDSFVPNIQLSQQRLKNFSNRIGLLGAISDIKGFYTLKELLILNKEKNYGLEFIVLGYTMNDAELLNVDDNLCIVGQYQETDFYELLLKTKIGLAMFLGTIPETYSFTLSLCLEHSIYPIAMDIGAIAERIRASNFGELIPLTASNADILNIIRNVVIKDY